MNGYINVASSKPIKLSKVESKKNHGDINIWHIAIIQHDLAFHINLTSTRCCNITCKTKNNPSTCCLIFARWSVKQVQTKGVMVGPCT